MKPAPHRNHWRAALFPWLAAIYLTAIFGLPTCAAVVCLRTLGPWSALALPWVWLLVFLLTAGLLSRPHQFAIRPGKFRRSVADRLYFHRRLYGLCWTAVYYTKPAYFFCLSVSALKRITFRLFGYRGSMDFTVYPDTWIRDLPLLRFGPGAYISNRATLGTNVVLRHGLLLVDTVSVGPGALIGHLAMVAPGVEVGAAGEVGVGVAVGIRSRLRERAAVRPCATIEHGVTVGEDAVVGTHAYVASLGEVFPREQIPGGSVRRARRDRLQVEA